MNESRNIGDIKTKILNDLSRYKLVSNYLEAVYDQAKEDMVANNDKFMDLTLKGEARAYKKLIDLFKED
jgi:hypothetical protein